MPKHDRLLKPFAAAAIAAMLCLGSALPSIAQTNFVILRGGASSGSWYAPSALMAKVMNEAIKGYNVTPTVGSADLNITEVNRGVAQYAFATSPSVSAAYNGTGAFKEKHSNVRAIFAFYPLTLQMLAHADSNIHTFADLAGKRISVGQRGFSTLVLVEELIEAAGLKGKVNISLLNFGDANQQFQDRQLDAIGSLTGYPNPAYTELNSVRPVRLVTLGDDLMNKYIAANPGFSRTVLPGGGYKGWNQDTPALASWTVIITRADRSDEEVYSFLKAIFERREDFWKLNALYTDFKPENMLQGINIPLHPGAERYLREIKVIK